MTSISPPFTASTLRLSHTPRFTHISTPIFRFIPHPRAFGVTKMCAVSERHERNSGARRGRSKNSDTSSSEAEDLVRTIMRNFTDKRPLMNILNKYVKLVRTEHCFLLFEELGKTDKWLQCLEVSAYLLNSQHLQSTEEHELYQARKQLPGSATESCKSSSD